MGRSILSLLISLVLLGPMAGAQDLAPLEDTLRDLEERHELDPSNLEIQTALARTWVRHALTLRGKNEKRAAYRAAAEISGELLERQWSYETLRLKLRAEVGAGLYPEAIETGLEAVGDSSAEWRSYLYLAQAYSSSRRYDDAVVLLQKALEGEKGPKARRRLLKELGFAFEKLELYQLAIESYEEAGAREAATRVRTNHEAHLSKQGIGETYLTPEEKKRALEELERELRELEEGGGGSSEPFR